MYDKISRIKNRLQQDHTVSRTDPVRAGFDQFFRKFPCADAAAGFHLQTIADGLFHQPDILDGGAAGGKSGGRLYKCGAGFLGKLASLYFFFISQQTSLDDDFYDRRFGCFHDCADIFSYKIPVLIFHSADIDHHVYFLSSGFDRFRRFKSLGRSEHCSKRETDNTACLYIASFYNGNVVETAQSNAENIISTYGDKLMGMYSGNNITGDGVCLAVQGSGIADKIVNVAVDSDDTEITALRDGYLDAIVVQDAYAQGYKCMENAILTLINGENPESEKQVNCPPVVITKDNMDDVEMQDLLDPTRLKK